MKVDTKCRRKKLILFYNIKLFLNDIGNYIMLLFYIIQKFLALPNLYKKNKKIQCEPLRKGFFFCYNGCLINKEYYEKRC